MSAVNVFVGSERAFLLTDSSLYDGQGEIVGFACKGYVVDSWNGVVTGRGNMWGAGFAQALGETFGSFDEFIARSGPAIEREHKAAITAGELTAQALIQVTALGWSEREGRARAFMLNSDRMAGGEDGPLYVWVDVCDGEVSGHSVGPALGMAENWYLHRLGLEPDEDYGAADFDPEEHGIPLLEAQRRSKSDPDLCGFSRHVVGGGVHAFEVDRDGVTAREIHAWPDQVGELIRPAPRLPENKLPLVAPSFTGELGPEWLRLWKAGRIDPETLMPRAAGAPIAASPGPAGMSRQQRRLHDRQQRKRVKAA